MEFKQAQVVGLSHALIKRYQQFFELGPLNQVFVEQPQMQPAQIQLYLQQAFQNHYQLTVQFNVHQHIEQVTGQLIRQIDQSTYLLKEQRSNLYKIVHANQVHYILKNA